MAFFAKVRAHGGVMTCVEFVMSVSRLPSIHTEGDNGMLQKMEICRKWNVAAKEHKQCSGYLFAWRYRIDLLSPTRSTGPDKGGVSTGNGPEEVTETSTHTHTHIYTSTRIEH